MVCVLLMAGASAIFVAAPGLTVSVALEPVSPAADTLTLAVPVLVAVRFAVAMPSLALTGEVGLNEPVTPLTAKTMDGVLLVTVLPAAS